MAVWQIALMLNRPGDQANVREKRHSTLTWILWSFEAAVSVSPSCKAHPASELVYQICRMMYV